MKKKLIDIFPPQSREEKLADPELFEEKQARPSLPSKAPLVWVKFFVLAIVLSVVPAVLLHFMFARADIKVWPQITKLEINEQITVEAQTFQEEKEMTRVFPATGTQEKDDRAHGSIRVYNTSSGASQTLVASTRFISEGGRLFRSERQAIVPRSGYVDVDVVAAESGQEYNVEASKFSLPGLAGTALYTAIYGESFQPMKGGTQTHVAVVTREDVESAREQLIEALKVQATQSLLGRIPGNVQVVADSVTSVVLQDGALVNEGAELTQFNYSAKVKVSALGFQKNEADLLAKRIVQDSLDEGQSVNEQTLEIAYKVDQPTANAGALSIEVMIHVDQYDALDMQDLKGKLQGVKKNGFTEVFRQYPYLAKAEFSFWPFWVEHVPQSAERIHLDLAF